MAPRKEKNTGAKLIQSTRIESARDLEILFHRVDKFRTLKNQARGRVKFGRSRVQLRPDSSLLEKSFRRVLLDRRSSRTIETHKVPFPTFSTLLTASCGRRRYLDPRSVKRSSKVDERFLSSAGGLNPLVIVISVQNIEGLRDGTYAFDSEQNSLWLIPKLPHPSRILNEMINLELNREHSAAVFLVFVDPRRTVEKYGNRGWRYLFFETGAFSRNLELVSSALGIGCCHLGGYIEPKTILTHPFVKNNRLELFASLFVTSRSEDVAPTP